MTTGENQSFDYLDFCCKSLFFNKLSRLVITFLPKNKHLLISWLWSPSTVILEPKKIKSVTVSIVSPSICHEGMGSDAMILVFWMLSFKPTFSLYPFTITKRLFSSSSLFAIRVLASAYRRLLIFLPVILIPTCVSSSPAFFMIYSVYMLNKQEHNIAKWCAAMKENFVINMPEVCPLLDEDWSQGDFSLQPLCTCHF